jgi:hypothetical protein
VRCAAIDAQTVIGRLALKSSNSLCNARSQMADVLLAVMQFQLPRKLHESLGSAKQEETITKMIFAKFCAFQDACCTCSCIYIITNRIGVTIAQCLPCLPCCHGALVQTMTRRSSHYAAASQCRCRSGMDASPSTDCTHDLLSYNNKHSSCNLMRSARFGTRM